MSRCVFFLICLPGFAWAQDRPEELERTWTASLQAGMSSTFQMALGGTFGEGPDVHDKLTLSLDNVFRAQDSLGVFGWSTADLPTVQPNWQAGVQYKQVIFARGKRKLSVGGGVQRWILPMVKTGAQDWLAAGNLVYSTKVKRVPLVVTEDSWSLLRSTLPKGSLLYTQVYSEHALLRRGGFRVLLREGPQYTYSWGFYGAHGNRVLRYGGSLVLAWKDTTFEGGYRQQFGLQDRIPNNRYWWFALTRQVGGRL